METIDCHLFIEIIVSEGCIFHSRNEVEDDQFETYIGINGGKVILCITDEYINALTARMYLAQLGLARLCDALFPK